MLRRYLLYLAVGLTLGCDAPTTQPAGVIVIDAAIPDASNDALDAAMPDAAPDTLRLTLTRVPAPGLDPVLITVRGAKAPPTLTISRAPDAALERHDDGSYSYQLVPSQTGAYDVTVQVDEQRVSKHALVFADVADGWGQPQMVEGLVNTAGYEDGVTITPGGEYLFVQTGPYYFSSFILFGAPRDQGGCGGQRLVPERCTHPWYDTTIGPYTAPERPGFFDGRFDDGTQLHNSNLWQVGPDQAPNYAVSTMFYGFKRQPDGSYREPFWLAFEDHNDALVSPYGLSFRLNGEDQATVLFSLNDPSDGDMVDFDGDGTDDAESLFDVFTAEITLGQDTSVGEFLPGRPPSRGAHFPRLVNFGKRGIDGIAGTQGNAHLQTAADGSVASIWTDDEFDCPDHAACTDPDFGQIAVQVLTDGAFPNGTWQKVLLPEAINREGEQIQPFFTGEGLYYTDDTNVLHASYTGPATAEGYADAAHWGVPAPVLTKHDRFELGALVAVGEPTATHIGGVEHLFFVYAEVRGFHELGFPDIDMQAGFVRRE
jgi:hypothetical protein